MQERGAERKMNLLKGLIIAMKLQGPSKMEIYLIAMSCVCLSAGR